MYIIVIESMADARRVCRMLLSDCTMIAIDIEGVNLGREGSITLIQIATSENKVYCFDILALGTAVFSKEEYLGKILESERILKLCYDCRIDADVLKTKHNVEIRNAYDLQVLYTFIFQSNKDRYLKGLQHAMTMLHPTKQSEEVMQIKKEMKAVFLNEKGTHIFTKRPLTDKVLIYCAADVIYLFHMYNLWGKVVPVNVVVQASMYRMHRFGNRGKHIPPNQMSLVDFKQMPEIRDKAHLAS